MPAAQNPVPTESGNGSTAIHARVGTSAIDKVTRMFSAGLSDIFTEILQNSRRAGATRLKATIEQDNDTTRVTLADDGVGIADPAVLLTFGESGWKDGIAEAEDPAGLGLLSLSRRGCTLRWRTPGPDKTPGYRLALEPAHFLGRDAAHVVVDDSAPWPHGTSVTFEATEAPHTVRAFLETAALHYPLPVTIGGEAVKRRAFLDGALHAEPWKGLVFGVFKNRHCGLPRPRRQFSWPDPAGAPAPDRRSGRRRLVGTGGHRILSQTWSWSCRRAKKRWRARFWKRCARRRGLPSTAPWRRPILRHGLPGPTGTRRARPGLRFPNHPPSCVLWRPSIADTNYWDERSTFTAVGSNTPGSSPEQDMVMQADPEPPEAQALHRALKRARLQGGAEPALRLFAPEPRFDGYPWYDALARVTAIETRVTVDGTNRSLDSFRDSKNSGEPKRPEAIAMHLHVLHPPKSSASCFPQIRHHCRPRRSRLRRRGLVGAP